MNRLGGGLPYVPRECTEKIGFESPQCLRDRHSIQQGDTAAWCCEWSLFYQIVRQSMAVIPVAAGVASLAIPMTLWKNNAYSP